MANDWVTEQLEKQKANPFSEPTSSDVIDVVYDLKQEMSRARMDIKQRANIAFQLGRLKGLAFKLDSRVPTRFDVAELAKDLLDIERKIQEQLDKDFTEVTL